jgi:hypothetical protein
MASHGFSSIRPEGSRPKPARDATRNRANERLSDVPRRGREEARDPAHAATKSRAELENHVPPENGARHSGLSSGKGRRSRDAAHRVGCASRMGSVSAGNVDCGRGKPGALSRQLNRRRISEIRNPPAPNALPTVAEANQNEVET